jgi:Haem-binding domain
MRKALLYRTNRYLGVIWLALSLLGAAGCSTSAPNPATAHAVTADPEVGRILAVSCYDCHTTEGTSRWYAKLQPSRWFGNPALEQLNFSQWRSCAAQRRMDAVREIAAAVNAGTMPPADYALFHPQARLSAGEREAVARWAARETALPAHER